MTRRREHLTRWRVLAQDSAVRQVDIRVAGTEFAELVVGDWFHVERMGAIEFWFVVGDQNFDVVIHPGKKPSATVSHRGTGILRGGE